MRKFIKISVWLCITMIVAAATVRDLSAQSAKSSDDAAVWNEYNAMKKMEIGAGAIELAIPVLGCAYAGDSKPCIIPGVVRVVSFVGMVASSVDYDPRSGTGLLSLFTATYLGSTAWGAYTAYRTADTGNANLRKKMGIAVTPGIESGSVGVGLAIKF